MYDEVKFKVYASKDARDIKYPSFYGVKGLKYLPRKGERIVFNGIEYVVDEVTWLIRTDTPEGFDIVTVVLK